MTLGVGYGEMFKEQYGFAQHHRIFGSSNLLHAPARAAGSFSEPPVVGPTLQINLKKRSGLARLDFGAGGFDVPLTTGTYVVTPAGQPCSYEIPYQIDLLIIEFAPATFDDLARERAELGSIHASWFNDTLVVETAKRLWVAAGRGASDLEADVLTRGLAALILRSNTDLRPVSVPVRSPLATWQVRRVVDFIDAHLSENISLARLAALVGLSPNHFCMAFRVALGEPPHRYLLRRRVERAKNLLAGSMLTVTEIALAVGFSSSAHFATMFRQHVGISPSAYKRECLS